MTSSLLKFCPACARYSLQETCPVCRGATRSPHPMRFSPQDRWARYRRALLDEVAHRGA